MARSRVTSRFGAFTGSNRRGPIAVKPVRILERVARIAFTVLSVALMALATALLLFAIWRGVKVIWTPEYEIGSTLLDSIGYTVIALAVFEVAKYIFEEEVVDPREMRHVAEARRGITKFISTIAIAVFLEALVLVFSTGKDAVEQMLYPTLLLFAGISMIVGLGFYQRMSTAAERTVRDPEPEAEISTAAERTVRDPDPEAELPHAE